MRLAPVLRLLALLVSSLLALPPAAHAQLVQVPPFTVHDEPGESAVAPDVAVGADSAMEFLWLQIQNNGRNWHAVVRHVASDGSAIGPLIRVDDDSNFQNPTLEPDTRGGFIAAWRPITNEDSAAIDARFLDGSGALASPIFRPVSGGPGYTSWLSTFTGISTGAVATYAQHPNVFAQRFDTAGQPDGPVITVRTYTVSGSVPTHAVATSNGGFVVAWDERPIWYVRPYDAAGQPLAPATPLMAGLYLSELAASPVGGFAVVGGSAQDSYRHPRGLWFQSFDANAVALGPETLVARIAEGDFAQSRLGFDPTGRLLVAWVEPSFFAFGQGPAARLYAADGTALARAGQFSAESTRFFTMSPRPDGRFVVGWEGQDSLRATVIAPCAPPAHTGCGNGVVEALCEGCDQGAANSDVLPNACRSTCQVASCGDGVVDAGEQCDDGNNVGCDDCDPSCHVEVGHVCGDGILFPGCDEQCDDGAANDDTTPNACRTTCVPPSCGDGVLDAGEGCDDGNTTSCDGCSEFCVPEPGLVCGDGITEPACGEQCDDANAVVGDGCSEPCRLERIPGGGAAVTDCVAEWSIDNPANVPLLDTRGDFNRTQSCVDGDPRCDFDGVTGRCTFHLRVCVNNTDVAGCEPERDQRLQSWALRAPSAAKAAKRPELAAVRAALAGVSGQIVGPEAQDVCSDVANVPVELRVTASGVKRGTVSLKSTATPYRGGQDKDALKLVCLPAS